MIYRVLKVFIQSCLIACFLLAVMYTPFYMSVQYSKRMGIASAQYDNQLEVLRQSRKSVVMLVAQMGLGRYGGGTGFIIKGGKTGKKFLITNSHICNIINNKETGPDELYISNDEFNKIATTQVLDNDILDKTGADLCVMEAPYGYPALNAGSDLEDGERVYVVGHPSLLPTSSVTGFIGPFSTQKIFYSRYGDMKSPYQLKTMLTNIDIVKGEYRQVEVKSTYLSTPIAPGNSGSPVLNIYGEVVGVLFATTGNGLSGFMVPFKEFKELVDRL